MKLLANYSARLPIIINVIILIFIKVILCALQKKALSKIVVQATVEKEVWKAFQEVNTLYEQGGLKEVSSGDAIRGIVNLKQWNMKPLSSLSDEQRLSLLRKVMYCKFIEFTLKIL